MRNVGTVVRGIRTPIIKANDDLANIVVNSLLKAKENVNTIINDALVGMDVFNQKEIEKTTLDVPITMEVPETADVIIENYKIATQSVVKLGTALNKAEEAFNAGDLEAFKNAFKNILKNYKKTGGIKK